MAPVSDAGDPHAVTFGPGESFIRTRSSLRSAFALVLATTVGLIPLRASAQSNERSTGETLGGAVLGGASGAMLGLLGGMEVCNRTLDPTRCSRVTAVTGGAIGLTAGAIIGARNESDLDDRFENAVMGTTIGAVVGLALKKFVRQYDCPDVAAASLIGSAIGASAEGAGLGFAAGATTGLLLWGMHPDVGPAGAVRWGLVGLAIGGLSDWVAEAAEGGTDMGALPLAFSIRR